MGKMKCSLDNAPEFAATAAAAAVLEDVADDGPLPLLGLCRLLFPLLDVTVAVATLEVLLLVVGMTSGSGG